MRKYVNYLGIGVVDKISTKVAIHVTCYSGSLVLKLQSVPAVEGMLDSDWTDFTNYKRGGGRRLFLKLLSQIMTKLALFSLNIVKCRVNPIKNIKDCFYKKTPFTLENLILVWGKKL